MNLSEVILRTTRATQPAATTVPAGTLCYVVDEDKTERSNGSVWQTYGDTGRYLHAHTHVPGGNDPLPADAAATTAALRTLGPGATQAAPGNDARLTNARPPTAHAPTHAAAGADPVTITALAGFPGGTTRFLRADGTFAATLGGGGGGGGSTVVQYRFSTALTGTPANENVRFNNGAYTAVTTVAIDYNSIGGADLYHGWAALGVGMQLRLQHLTNHTIGVTFTVTGAAVDRTGYFEIPVAWQSGAGVFANNQTVLITPETLAQGHAATHQSDGSDPLPADLRLGSSLALGTNPAQSGALRLANNGADVVVRNSANTSDYFALRMGGDWLRIGQSVLPVTLNGGPMRLDSDNVVILKTGPDEYQFAEWQFTPLQDAKNILGDPSHRWKDGYFSGDITAGKFIGDGSGLTNLGGGGGAHHASHEPGGADALVNVAWTNLANTFTNPLQQITGEYPALRLWHASGAVNSRAWNIISDGSGVHFQALTDAGGVAVTPLIVDRSSLSVSVPVSTTATVTTWANHRYQGSSHITWARAPGQTWHTYALDQFRIYPVNDAETVIENQGLRLDRAGHLLTEGAFVSFHGGQPALAGAIRIPVNQWIKSRNGDNTADMGLIAASSDGRVWIGESTPVYFYTDSIAIAAVPGTHAVTGAVRLANNAVITARNAANTGDINLVYAGTDNGVVVGWGAANVQIPPHVYVNGLSVAGVLSAPSAQFTSYFEKWQDVAISGGTLTVNLALGHHINVFLNQNISSIVFTNVPTYGWAVSVVFRFYTDGTQRYITWPNSRWPNGVAPTMTAAPWRFDVVTLYWTNGAHDVWFGFVNGQNM